LKVKLISINQNL